MCETLKKPLNKPFKPLSDPRDAVHVVLTKSPEAERENEDWGTQFLYNLFTFTFFPEPF